MDKDRVLEMAFDSGMNDFSENYVNSLENKDSYSLHEMQEAFKAGAKWARGFISVAEMLSPRL